MRVLIVAATGMEVAPLEASFPFQPSARALKESRAGGHHLDLLVTGVGMVATAAKCSETLALARYDLALNFGVCGSFEQAHSTGSVVHVVADRLCELGAEDGDRFLTLQDLKLTGGDEFPFTDGQLVNPAPPSNGALSALLRVRGITVNTVHGNEASIASVKARFRPQVESMEGAAFMYSCLNAGVSFAQVRAVSNLVEKRNRDSWNIGGAIEHLGRVAKAILDEL